MSTERTFNEAFESMTGYDELAVKDATGRTMSNILKEDELHAWRCVIALDKLHASGGQGQKAFKVSYDEAMKLTFKEVRAYFAEEPADDLDEDSEVGKDN